MQAPLVSIIVPTRNSGQFLDACLKSIHEQSYSNIELIVVDNNSTDNTKEIAQKYTHKVFNVGPERSAQRNFGAKEALGEFVIFIDSDMVLSKEVITQCVEASLKEGVAGVIIPEESFGEGFWAQCKKLERSFYVGIDGIEAARFCRKADFESIRGYDTELAGGEDWDLHKKLSVKGGIARIAAYIYHNEGHPRLLSMMKKRYYYGKGFKKYTSKNSKEADSNQTSVIQRYMLFLKNPARLLKDPAVGIGMLFMKTCEFGAIALAMI